MRRAVQKCNARTLYNLDRPGWGEFSSGRKILQCSPLRNRINLQFTDIGPGLPDVLLALNTGLTKKRRQDGPCVRGGGFVPAGRN